MGKTTLLKIAAHARARIQRSEFLINYLPLDALSVEDLLGYYNKDSDLWYEGILEKVNNF